MHNLQMTIKLYDPNYRLMGLRHKLCRVKIPSIVQPVFFDQAVLLEEDRLYRILVEFDHEDAFKGGSLGARFKNKTETLDAPGLQNDTFQVQFVNCCEVVDGDNICSYSEAGQVRIIYFWPVVNFKK